MDEEYLNTQEFLLKFKEGYGDEYKSLFEVYYQPLINFAYLLIKRIDECEDIVLVALSQVWQNSNYFSSQQNIKLFLYSNVRERCSAFLHYNQKTEEGKAALSYTNSDYENIESYTYSKMNLFSLLDIAINELNKFDQEILISVCIKREKVEEVAKRLNISHSIVNSVINKIVRNWRISLNSEPYPYRRASKTKMP